MRAASTVAGRGLTADHVGRAGKRIKRPSRRPGRDAGVKWDIDDPLRHAGYFTVGGDVDHILEACRRAEGGTAAARRAAADPASLRFLLPAGIGDVAWCYKKLHHLSALAGRKVVVYAADDRPRRAGDLAALLPNVLWGGYLPGTASMPYIYQSLPASWPAHLGLAPLSAAPLVSLAPNVFLELGGRIENWLPLLPTCHHYPVRLPARPGANGNGRANGNGLARLLASRRRPRLAVYVSNRDKERFKRGGWHLWSVNDWSWLLTRIMRLPACRHGCFVLLGAAYDRDKTQAVARRLRAAGHTCHLVLGKPLADALAVLRTADYFFSYPGGLGILADVLAVPCLMLLPWHLAGLERAYADPVSLANCTYRAWPAPTPQQVLDWFANVAVHVVADRWT